MNKTGIIIVIIVILGIGAYALSNKNKTDDQMMNDEMTATINQQDTTYVPNTATTPSSEVTTKIDANIVVGSKDKEFTVVGTNFAFAPSIMKVNKGDTVKIIFKNSGGTHDLKIDEFNVATNKIASGASETITFVADKTGTFEYYCSIGSHRAMGMKGTLTVQ